MFAIEKLVKKAEGHSFASEQSWEMLYSDIHLILGNLQCQKN